MDIKGKLIIIGGAVDKGSFTEKNLDKDLIKYTYKKYGERSYLITIDKLEAGEYAITVNSNRSGTFYLFGVD